MKKLVFVFTDIKEHLLLVVIGDQNAGRYSYLVGDDVEPGTFRVFDTYDRLIEDYYGIVKKENIECIQFERMDWKIIE